MNTDIHRLLDEAFAGVEMTPAAQDLKEEIRANLVAQVDELTATGTSPDEAARRAISDLGDVRDLLEDASTDSGRGVTTPDYIAIAQRNRVRPKPGFIVRAVLWSALVVIGVTLSVLGATGALPLPAGPIIGLLGVAATGVGLLVGDSLSQETTTNHPMPQNRAASYALASFLGLYGLGFIGLVVLQSLPVWCVVFGASGGSPRSSCSPSSAPPRRTATRRGRGPHTPTCLRTASSRSPRPPRGSASTPP
ncbi:permease prefix domain 1-containing protein [Microbacterium sp. KUDC0406]|uniref:permease prefix domain 1-containing protein n=1 Tax=Microbacterium sp. KUDC0406 TaxID=2909588 RepID=UPI001F17BB5A|nr:permease prefix domain 1-containing protein [Microbacterium sp. KUDC0406]UJP10434.1 permease prefix domain 1-containing protein [Microbacterium sp. KUDC0406]